MNKKATNDLPSNEATLVPALSDLGELAEEPVQPRHPLAVLPQATTEPRINRPRHRQASPTKRQNRRPRQRPQAAPGTKDKMPFRRRWPRGLDVRHTKNGIDDLQGKFDPIAQNRLREYGRFHCEPLSHVDLARAFMDYCRERVRLPRDASPRTYSDLLRVVDEAMNAWAASEFTRARDTPDE